MLLLNSTKKVQQVWVSLFGGPHIMFSNKCMKWRSIEEHSHLKFYWTAHIIGRSLKGALIGYSVIKTSVCLSVCSRATGHSF